MKFDQFIKILAGRAGVKQKDARAVMKEVPGALLDVVQAEGRLAVPGLGIFRAKELARRVYNTPYGRVLGGGKRVLRFVPSEKIKKEGI